MVKVEKLTEKFAKELNLFFEWANEQKYVVMDISSEVQKWSVSLVPSYEEPGRNKLKKFIEKVLECFTIKQKKSKIEDASLLAKEYKGEGEKVVPKPKGTKVESEIEKKVKKVKKVESEIEEPKKKVKKVTKVEITEEEKPKKVKVEPKKKVKKVEVSKPKKVEKVVEKSKSLVVLDMSLDTSETESIETLEYWTSELIGVFGKPKKTGTKHSEHTYEWKVYVNGETCSIYDDKSDEEELENRTWYLSGTEGFKARNVKLLHEYIKEMGEVDEEVEEVEDEEVEDEEVEDEEDEEVEEVEEEDEKKEEEDEKKEEDDFEIHLSDLEEE